MIDALKRTYPEQTEQLQHHTVSNNSLSHIVVHQLYMHTGPEVNFTVLALGLNFNLVFLQAMDVCYMYVYIQRCAS